MATRKTTVSLDVTSLDLAERAAARDGVSLSAWLSRAARREAVRTGVGPVDAGGLDDVLAEALTDERERELAENEGEGLRAAG